MLEKVLEKNRKLEKVAAYMSPNGRAEERTEMSNRRETYLEYKQAKILPHG
jgi:hypothetical protein